MFTCAFSTASVIKQTWVLILECLVNMIIGISGALDSVALKYICKESIQM